MGVKDVNPFSIDDEVGPEPTPTTEDPVVKLDEDDDPGDEPDVPQTRQGKKAARTWMNKDERDRLERENVEARAQASANAQALNQVTQLLQRLPMGPQQAPQKHPIDDELDRVKRDRIALDRDYDQKLATGKITQKDLDDMREKAVELDHKAMGLIAQKNAPQVQQADPQRQAVVSYLVANFPEATQNPQVMAYAEGIQRTLAAQGKAPWAVETINEAMGKAEQFFKVGRYKDGAPRVPDSHLRDRLQGAPRGSSGAPQSKKTEFVMKKEFRRMADKAFPHITDDAKRYRHWYNEVGSTMADED